MPVHDRRPAFGAIRIVVLLSCAGWLLCSAGASARQKPATGAAASRPTFDDLYRRGQKANDDIRTLTARFTETTTSSLLKRPLVARGTLYVQRPTRVALHYVDPEGRTVLIDGNTMTTSWPSRNVLLTSDISRAQRNVQRYFVAKDADELRDIFDIALQDVSSRPGTYEVTMRPKPKQIREALTRLDLWAGESSSLLNAMRMTFKNGDTKLMEFEDVVPNAAIDAAVFSAPKSGPAP